MLNKRNYARNFQEGIFKLCEINMEISAHEHAFIPSEAQWFSADQNSAKQRFFFTENDKPRKLHTVKYLRIVYEFLGHSSKWQMIDWPITDPNRGMVEMIIPDQILTVGTTEMLQHVYLIQPEGFVADQEDNDDGYWDDDEDTWNNFGVLKPFRRFDTKDRWIDVGVVHSNINLSFVDKDIEPMRDFYISRFEDVKREIYEIRDHVSRVLGEVDVDQIVEAAINEFLETNAMPTVEWVNQIHLQSISHIVDNIRHINPEDRFNIHNAIEHTENPDVHLSEDDRLGIDEAKFHARDANVHISPEEREMIHRIYEMDPDNQENPELSIDSIDGLREKLETMQKKIEELQNTIDSMLE